MRPSKSRSRGKGNSNRRSVGNVINRVFDSSGPEGKVRGTPQQIIEKYQTLARDATLANDRVAAENFQQHAEHYTRLLSEAMREQEARREQQEAAQQNRRDRDRGGDGQGQNPGQNPGQGGQRAQDQQPSQQQDQPREERRQASADVVDMGDEDEGSGLVETPESAPKKPRRARRKSTGDGGGGSNNPDGEPQAAE
ncbi:DUF4167 domain-containing protein [Maritimibacter sp. 55A14]|uniref:DUF4167 domain-containing protein n=1 Tax=Maritimibacter sp. 55A14 TaxID=2174844 RepID=UPI000D60B9DF|nr:DUF4167 domain-containing protein [Maritimibacter sp. 55A14]PWE34170.1 DUF4167 domain-containing protein [Maritimibacter sp. 55A14]